MSAPIWMPLYVSDYLGDTGHLSTVEHGAYMLLIMHYWQHGGLPDDDEKLARIARLRPKEWSNICSTLADLFLPGWRHKRIDAELAKAQQVIDKRRAAGRASAEQRANKSSTHVATHVEHVDQQTGRQLQPQSQEVYSDAYASAPPSGAPPPDPVKELWARGVAIVGDTPHGRSLFGKMRKQCGDVAVLGAIVQCEADLPSEPISYFVQCCEQRRSVNGRASPVTKLYEGAARAVEAVLERDRRAGEPAAEPLLDGGRSPRGSPGPDRRLA